MNLEQQILELQQRVSKLERLVKRHGLNDIYNIRFKDATAGDMEAINRLVAQEMLENSDE